MSDAAAVDIVVLGGGMVGASLAVALAPLGLRVAVVEARRPGAPGQPSYDDRATAVSMGSRRILETIGVWNALDAGATPIRKIHVSQRGRFGATRLDSVEEQVPALGYVVENRVLGRALWQRLEAADNVQLVCPATLTELDSTDAAVRVTCETGDGQVVLTARLAVAADGAQSQARSLAGIEATAEPYGQTAVITNVTSREPHDGTAFERFTDDGPLAFLPMSNGRSSVVWTLATDAAPAVVELDDAAFIDALQACFGYRLGRLLKVGARHGYPLSLTRAEAVTGDRVALVGNAANGLHPVAGQGLNLGLRDVATLADVVADAVADAAPDNDLGSAVMLNRYREWR
ncbi:MAG: 2-octaprenyl-6-methoxyphenyl hydroxylase, partial [Pseudomonadota bacterium]